MKENATVDKSKEAGSDEEDEDEQDAKQKEKGMSNKKKKVCAGFILLISLYSAL